MSFISCIPVPLISLSLLILTLSLQHPQIKNKTKQNKKPTKQEPNKTKHRKHLISEALVCHSVSHSAPFHPVSLFAHLHCNDCWSVIGPLASATLSILDSHQDSFGISCHCPVQWRSCSFGSVGLAALHVLQ